MKHGSRTVGHHEAICEGQGGRVGGVVAYPELLQDGTGHLHARQVGVAPHDDPDYGRGCGG